MSATTPAKQDAAKPSNDGQPTESPDERGASVDAPESGTPSVKTKKKRLGVDPSLIISDGRSKRRKSPTPEAEEEMGKGGGNDPKDPARAKTLGYQIYNKIMTMKSADGEALAEPFIKLPNKRAFPDYYETIKVPMSLEMVHERLENGTYDSLKAVVSDIGQIFNNAKRYNVKESAIFQYAKKLHKLTRTFYVDATSGGQGSASAAPESDDEEAKPSITVKLHAPVQLPAPVESEEPDIGGPSNASADGEEHTPGGGRFKKRGSYMKEGPTVYKLVKPILKAIKEAQSKDGSGRLIADIFVELPDRRLFTDYYKTIKEPVSLREIEDRMMARAYEHWQEFYHDVGLMCRNAMVYNEDGSAVFRDAQQISEILESYRPSIQEKLAKPAEKIRIKPVATTPYQNTPNPHARPQQYAQSPSPANFHSQSPQPPTTLASAAGYGTMAAPPTAAGASGVPGSFLPALPKGVVTEEIVASLERYPQYEQSAWANSLSPLAVQVYRQLVNSLEAKKRGVALPPSAALADLPSSGRPNGVSQITDRAAPPLPTIKLLEFAFSTGGHAERDTAIRLHNMRGVVTHAVVLASDTTELELTAYVADPPKFDAASTPAGTVEAIETVPEVSLRVNGNQGSLPKFIHLPPESSRPAGMRWTINVPPGRSEMKVEVIATKPGQMAETSAIYVSRQY